MPFADCSDNVASLTPAQICEGFTKCGTSGVPMNSAGFNAAIRLIEAQIAAVPIPDGSETIVTQGANVTVTGTGTIADPYVVAAAGGSPTVDGVSVFDNAGTLEAVVRSLPTGTFPTTYAVFDSARGGLAIHTKDTASGFNYPYTIPTAFVVGPGTTLTAPGYGSFSAGIGAATGQSAFSAGFSIATGDGAFSGGYTGGAFGGIFATGQGAVALGYGCLVASGQGSVALGRGETSTGARATGTGSITLAGPATVTNAQNYSLVMGVGGTAGNSNLGIGTPTPSEKLHVIGNILASGTITPSDERLKKNIADDDGAWVLGLAPRTFNMRPETFHDIGAYERQRPVPPGQDAINEWARRKAEADRDGLPFDEPHPNDAYDASLAEHDAWIAEATQEAAVGSAILRHGFIAQEVQQVAPELVRQSGDILTVDYQSVISGLVAQVKSLNARLLAAGL